MSDKFWTIVVVIIFIVSEMRHAWAVHTWAKVVSDSNKDWFDYCRRRIDREADT